MTSYIAQANTGSDALASSRAVSKPGGVAAGAVGVFWLSRWNEASSFPAVTPPSGAVLRGTVTTTRIETLCYLLKIGAEATFTFSWTNGRWAALSAKFIDGVDPALDLSTVPFQSATGTGTTITTLTVATVNSAALAWHVNTLDGGVASHTPPTSFTEVADVAPWASAYRISPGDGSQSAAGATLDASALWGAGLVALAPASSVSEQTLPPAGEADTAQPLVAAKSASVPTATAPETALPIQGGKAISLTAAVALEAAQPLTGGKTAALPAALTAEVAQVLAGAKVEELSAATSTESAEPLTGSKTAVLTTASAVETAQILTGSKSAVLDPALEADTAVRLTAPVTERPSPDRTYRIPAESRIHTVPAESRTFTIRR